MNQIYFGENAYGVEAAARVFFGKRAKDLTLYESALLVAAIPSPSHWNLAVNPQEARARLVLDEMVKAGRLTEHEAERAVTRGIRKGEQTFHRIESRYFTDWLRPQLEALLKGKQGFFTVYTTLDPKMQAYAERAVEGALAAARKNGASQVAALALEPDGSVRTLIGSANYAESSYNRAVQARRQAGSAFKPIVYLAALEAGWDPERTILDTPLTIDGWSPRNIDGRYLGRMTLRTTLARSRNVAAVRLLSLIDRAKVIETARRLGIRGRLPDDPSLALGTGELTLLELVGAYAPFANGGYRVQPYGIIGVRDAGGTVLYWRSPSRGERVVRPKHVREMNAMLKAVLSEGGTGTRAALAQRSAAGKTGTTQGYRDAWFVGYTADLVAGIWLGNDDNMSMNGVTGGTYPASIWRSFMTDAHRYLHLASKPLPGEGDGGLPGEWFHEVLEYLARLTAGVCCS